MGKIVSRNIMIKIKRFWINIEESTVYVPIISMLYTYTYDFALSELLH